jgi:phosphohistidine swiveling domain-containing protein
VAHERLQVRHEASRMAWRRFGSEHPEKVAGIRRRVARWARALHEREAARSEVMRVYGVVRAFVVRAGDLTGHHDDLFFLTIDEILAVLDGDARPLDRIPARRRAYERYRALAPYPTVIRGRFDPIGWAKGGGDLAGELGATEGPVHGLPGAAGVAEGRVRVLNSPERAGELRDREILVTSVADIGWAPLFPRAGAVVTDIGGPLSDAATVARELAVPAVLGCGDATQRLRTGDHVRVDATRGTIHVISAEAEAIPREPQLTTEG